LKDYLGGFAVTIHGADELAKKFSAEHDDYNAIMTKALADRLAEAFAEYLHKQARVAWGFGRDENLSEVELIREKYRGIRPAAGYPASPDHAEKRILFDLLKAEDKIEIKLTESDAMYPGASVSGLYFRTRTQNILALVKLRATKWSTTRRAETNQSVWLRNDLVRTLVTSLKQGYGFGADHEWCWILTGRHF